ncbi:MAG: hypothetical protein ACSW8J_01570, partial [bacterium]
EAYMSWKWRVGSGKLWRKSCGFVFIFEIRRISTFTRYAQFPTQIRLNAENPHISFQNRQT